jgi:hypothetical protein
MIDFESYELFAALKRQNLLSKVGVHMKSQSVETQAVMSLMENYYSCVYAADTEALRSLFHEKAVMFGFSGRAFLSGTPEPFFTAVGSEPSSASIGAECAIILTQLRVSGREADASLLVSGFYGAVTVEDKFDFVKENGDWKIICKTISVLG